MSVHVVRAGERLWQISKQYGVSIESIVRVNGLASASVIVPGLALYIPDDGLASRVYRVKAGDALWKIAQRFRTTISSIAGANPGLDIHRLRIGQVLVVPSPIKLAMRTVGFLVPSGTTADLSVIDSLANQLTYVAVVNYSFTAAGYAFAERDDSAIVARCKQLNIAPLLMIRNVTSSGFSAELVGSVLANPTYRQHLAASIANLAATRGFRGVSLDLEFIPPARRNDFSLFLRDLKLRLGNLLLHVNVHAKTEDLPTNRIVGAYDYAAIGAIADVMAVMTIDYGYPGGPPDPISPINWVEQVVKYAVSLVTPRKLMMAMALYGYDKVVSTNAAKGLSVLAAQNHAISLGRPIQFDSTAQSPWYRYWSGTDEHIVWFEDIRSFIKKTQLIDQYNLMGTTYWQISLPAPQNWAYVSSEIVVVKQR
ncbi:LysM peptidoglycan-binding domain-containing protein [Neobacillus sp. YIM B06451]|uniref:LysM peptidoglycan-binding domain-containing protein n=1 Tax=Neobacillus sp. YIM B06451 TaxID=3070994 RepID=UPI00292E6901|nr:LysM peptidoglycan-binding domain-containing protein [Neobacillus sp. YIM B06451]